MCEIEVGDEVWVRLSSTACEWNLGLVMVIDHLNVEYEIELNCTRPHGSRVHMGRDKIRTKAEHLAAMRDFGKDVHSGDDPRDCQIEKRVDEVSDAFNVAKKNVDFPDIPQSDFCREICLMNDFDKGALSFVEYAEKSDHFKRCLKAWYKSLYGEEVK